MTTMTHPERRFAHRRHNLATAAAFVVLFWIVAAALIFEARAELEPRSPKTAAVAAVAALIVTAYAYTRVAAREAGITHALGVGVTWLALSIAAEIMMAVHTGHGWFTLLGSPDYPLLRHVLLFAWIFAPALFARREED